MRAVLFFLFFSCLGFVRSQSCKDCVAMLAHLGPDDVPSCSVVLDFLGCVEKNGPCSGTSVSVVLVDKANAVSRDLNCEAEKEDGGLPKCKECDKYTNETYGTMETEKMCNSMSEYVHCIGKNKCAVAQVSRQVIDITSALCYDIKNTKNEDCLR